MGPEALHRVAQAFRFWESRQAAVAHNLANLSSPGYKAERVFASLLDNEMLHGGGRTDFAAGPLTQTGRPLDLALEGEGFLVVETPQGERWVRGGSFQLDESRMLVDAHGNRLLGESGPLLVPDGRVDIGPDGEVRVEGTVVGVLRLEKAGAGAVLRREGEGRWVVEGERMAAGSAGVSVRQGWLEESNVDPVGALVEMIEIQRGVAALQRSVLVLDGVLERISNDLGKVR